MKRRQCLASLGLAPLVPGALRAQAPTLRLVVPTPAGGPSDTAARVVAQAFTQRSGRQVVVENRPGAGGALAARAVLDARPDGQTLLWALGSMSGIPVLQKSPPFASLAVFTPVVGVGAFVFALFVPADLPARSVAELADLARSRPGTLSIAHGTLGEWMAAAQFLQAAGLRATLVPYKGGAQLMPDLVSARVQANFGPLSSGLAHVQAGKLRALAVMAGSRSPLLPEVPTLREAGIATGALPSWQALLAAPGTPAELVRPLAGELLALLQDGATRATLERQGLQVEAAPPPALAATIQADARVWQEFVAANQIAAE